MCLLYCSLTYFLETGSLTKLETRLSPFLSVRAIYRHTISTGSCAQFVYMGTEDVSADPQAWTVSIFIYCSISSVLLLFLVVDFLPCSAGNGTRVPWHTRPRVQSTTELENSFHIFGFVSTLLLKLYYLQISTTLEKVFKTSVHRG